MGFRVNLFNDPTSALENFKAGMYDLLLLDIRMSDIGGYELYRQMRKTDDNVKVAFLTAN